MNQTLISNGDLSFIDHHHHHHYNQQQQHVAHSTPVITLNRLNHHPRLIDKSMVKKSTINNQSKSMYNHHGYNLSNTQSESEFDTSQINLYLRQKRLFPKRILHNRSRSVDSSRHYRQSSSSNFLHGHDQENISPILNNNNNNNTYTIPLKSSSMTTSILKRNDVKMEMKSNSPIITTDNNLNSEGSSISGEESSSGEYNDELNDCKLNNRKRPITVMKSVLKKSSSQDSTVNSSSLSMYLQRQQQQQRNHFISSLSLLGIGSERFFRFGNQQQSKNSRQNSAIMLNYKNNDTGNNKKNVTFSAYATIQMVDT
ncbi:hypothetical protein BLA29_001933 [Euroglyphus maynei]|uniref:Uncharacterized protein n=1 Tax=Euroglyphus maynei TaxID=6958 RepID=A0A1Y3AMR6_EURMA|nr:hypothetical protein BLA29_001933 [Euroglyphus maynei]